MEDNERQQYDRFDSLIARHRGLIDSLCTRHALGDVNRCEELRQECYISIWYYLPTLRNDAKPFHETAWVVWHCRSVFSHLHYQRRTLHFQPIDDNTTDTIGEPDDDRLGDILDTLAILLTPHERRAFYLMAEGYSAEEIALELGIKHRSAVLLRHRIIEKLRQNISKQQNNNL